MPRTSSSQPPLTHEQRLALIYKPVPVVRYVQAMPHAGTITGDNFYDHEALELVAGYRRAHIDRQDVEYATRLFGFSVFTPAEAALFDY